jgi:hypothetical protein
MKLATFITAIVALSAAGQSSAQCLSACNETHCIAYTACESTYDLCVANAQGNPQAIEVCLQQRTACRSAASVAFHFCAIACGFPSIEPCLIACGIQYGFELSNCRDLEWACLQNGGTPEHCAASYDGCAAAAAARYSNCLLSCPCGVVAVEPSTWGRIKLLYRD